MHKRWNFVLAIIPPVKTERNRPRTKILLVYVGAGDSSVQLFRPGWVSSAECMPHRIGQPTQGQLSIKLCARGDDDGLKFKCLPIEHRHTERVTMTQ